MAEITVAKPGLIQGGSDALAMYLKIFAGETITAFERASVTFGRHLERTIESGE